MPQIVLVTLAVAYDVREWRLTYDTLSSLFVLLDYPLTIRMDVTIGDAAKAGLIIHHARRRNFLRSDMMWKTNKQPLNTLLK